MALGFNEAIFMKATEKEGVMEIISEFQKVTNIPLEIEETTFMDRQTGIAINGKEFNKQPYIESWSGYVARVKEYLFDLIIKEVA